VQIDSTRRKSTSRRCSRPSSRSDPTTLNRRADAGTQYRSAIFFTIDQQAVASMIARLNGDGIWGASSPR
jgi:hypothetical protein